MKKRLTEQPGKSTRKRGIPVRGDVITATRLALGWTQRELSDRAGLSERLVRRAETSQSIDSKSILVLSQTLKLPSQSLVDLNPAPQQPDLIAKRSADFLVEVWNHGNLAIVDEHFVPEFQFHHESGIVCNRDEMKERILKFRESFGEFHIDILDAKNFGAFCVVWWRCALTHIGEWMELPATGRRVAFDGTSWVQVVGDRFGDAWDYWDPQLLFQALARS